MNDVRIAVEHSTDDGKTWDTVRIRRRSVLNHDLPLHPVVFDDGVGNLYRRIGTSL